jgi:aspartate/methionine/tyrosine aminotransferase
MSTISEKFQGLGIDHAPGQENKQTHAHSALTQLPEKFRGRAVDFSHGDVGERAFEPTPGSIDAFIGGYEAGGEQAYTEYRGSALIRELIAPRLASFTGHPVSPADGLILTPGTQSALFLAVSATVVAGDRVAIMLPDYFANRKLIEFVGAQVVPVSLNHLGAKGSCAGLDLATLESAFSSGVKTFLFSNPNNPTGVVYNPQEIQAIARLANRYGVTVIIDQLYSRLLYSNVSYTHLRAAGIADDQVVTIMGPSKTESLSGFRLGVAFGAPHVVDRMEKLQAIVSLRAPGYSQAVLKTWFDEPEGWMAARIASHQNIRDDLLHVFRSVAGMQVRSPDAGSYLFLLLPKLSVSLVQFVRDLREHAGVTVTPGTEFSPHATNSVRLNFSQNHSDAVDAARRLAQVVDVLRA